MCLGGKKRYINQWFVRQQTTTNQQIELQLNVFTLVTSVNTEVQQLSLKSVAGKWDNSNISG